MNLQKLKIKTHPIIYEPTTAITDFIILHYKDIYFPAVFNIADLSISIGAVLIIIYYMSNKANEIH